MKKLFALLLAVLMIATMSVTAFAADTTTVTDTSNQTITVTGTYVADTPAEVISIDISWGSMAFTYTAGTQVWDPAEHTYTTGEGKWSCDTDANKITVANHSNVNINVTVFFTDNTGNGIKGWFYDRTDAQVGSENFYGGINIRSAASEEWLGKTNAPTDEVYFKITGGAISANSDNLGTITLAITNLGQ